MPKLSLPQIRALLDEAKAAYKSKFTPGFYHGSPSPNIKAFDPLKNTDPNKLETPGVTFATRDTDFAESFLPGSNRGGYKSGATMYPVSINLGKHWHPNTPEGKQVVSDYIDKMYPYEANPKDLVGVKKQMLEASWEDIENPNFIKHLQDTGHDSFHVMEGGIPNIGVFEPQNIRGKFAEFNPDEAMNPDFMKAQGGSVEGYAGGGNVISGLAKFLEGAKIPQRLYHGTTIAEENGAKALSQLKQSKEGALGAGVYMTPNTEFSNLYANQPGGYVMPVHTNLKNPLEIHSTQDGADPMKMALMQLGVPEAKAEQILEKAYDTRGYVGKEVMSRAQKQGYDGLAQYHDGNLSEVVSYNPYSIKSATGNTGEFNPYDPRLSKKTGGSVEGYAGGGKITAALEALEALAPQSTVKAYKLFRTNPKTPGELYPLFVNASESVPVGQWVNASTGPLTDTGKVKSKIGDLAYRPGWHAGDMPVATHIGGKSSSELTAPDHRPANQVWAEIEMPNDVDWQSIANQRAQLNKAGQPIARTAQISDQVPEGGHYRYKTNPNMTGDWLIGGSMKVNKVLTDDEVKAINSGFGVSDLPRLPE